MSSDNDIHTQAWGGGGGGGGVWVGGKDIMCRLMAMGVLHCTS